MNLTKLTRMSSSLESKFLIGDLVSTYQRCGVVQGAHGLYNEFKPFFPRRKPKLDEALRSILRSMSIKIRKAPLDEMYCYVSPFEDNAIYMLPYYMFYEATQGDMDEAAINYKSVILHELVHMTGFPSRLNRNSLMGAIIPENVSAKGEEEATAILGELTLSEVLGYEMTPIMREQRMNEVLNFSLYSKKDKTYYETTVSSACEMILRKSNVCWSRDKVKGLISENCDATLV